MSTPYSSANSPYAYSPIPISTPLPSLTPSNLNAQQNRYNNNNNNSNNNNSSNSPKPIPIPLLQRPRHPSLAGGSLKHSNITGGLGGGGGAIEDSILETKKVCALLLGVGAGEGLLAELERGLINAVKRRDNAFEEVEEGDESTKGPR